MCSLRYLLLLEKDVPRAVEFLQRGVGASVKVATTSWAELEIGDTIVALKQSPGSTDSLDGRLGSTDSLDSHKQQRPSDSTFMGGHSPMMVFDVDDLQERLVTMIQMGAQMDGSIQYTVEGSKVAVVKSPSGHILGMIEAEGSPRWAK